MLKRLWREDEGILTFEWILLLTLLVIGVVGGVAAIRDAIIHEAQGVVGAMVNLDQSYYIHNPLNTSVSDVGGNCCSQSTAVGSSYTDSNGNWATGCAADLSALPGAGQGTASNFGLNGNVVPNGTLCF